jgi:hypothetical protein
MATPILMLTAMEGEYYERVSLETGADDFILKTASIPSIVSRRRAQIHLTRKRNAPPVAPAIGEPLALDPRVEDPMESLMLDIAGGTFALRPSPGSNAATKMRAEYTIELVKLNRDVLIRGRKEAFDNYLLRFKDFIAKRDDGSSNAQLDAVISSIKRMQHPTVWNEIRRQQEDISMLGKLFEAAPEALGW